MYHNVQTDEWHKGLSGSSNLTLSKRLGLEGCCSNQSDAKKRGLVFNSTNLRTRQMEE